MVTHRVVSIRPASLGNLLGVISLCNGAVIVYLIALVHLGCVHAFGGALLPHVLHAGCYSLVVPPLFFLLAYSSGCTAAAFYNRFVAGRVPLVVETTEP